MKKQTQEQFLETIDGLLAINDQLRKDLADREAEIAKLRSNIYAIAWNRNPGDRRSPSALLTDAERMALESLSTTPTTSYLKQWVADNFEIVAWRDTGSGILDSYTRHKTNYVNINDIVQTPLYARKEK